MIKVYLTDHVWLVHTVIDQWGEPMTVTHTPLNGKLVYKTRKVIDFKGEEVISEFSVLLATINIDHDDKIQVVPDAAGEPGFHWPIKTITKPADWGIRFLEVFL